MHDSLLPGYANGENEVGVTAHMTSSELDAGDIVVRNRSLAIERVRTDNGSEYAATEYFRTMGGCLTSHP